MKFMKGGTCLVSMIDPATRAAGAFFLSFSLNTYQSGIFSAIYLGNLFAHFISQSDFRFAAVINDHGLVLHVIFVRNQINFSADRE